MNHEHDTKPSAVHLSGFERIGPEVEPLGISPKRACMMLDWVTLDSTS